MLTVVQTIIEAIGEGAARLVHPAPMAALACVSHSLLIAGHVLPQLVHYGLEVVKNPCSC